MGIFRKTERDPDQPTEQQTEQAPAAEQPRPDRKAERRRRRRLLGGAFTGGGS
ncbi:hypothetical protein ABZV91_14520 [Nocardia sp. NPDC004568]|uniref:hypothetical protein n=1 Tax=Nocardia sp. NPDC004568 TaxID=3154551 RepID=UPI0033A3D391